MGANFKKREEEEGVKEMLETAARVVLRSLSQNFELQELGNVAFCSVGPNEVGTKLQPLAANVNHQGRNVGESGDCKVDDCRASKEMDHRDLTDLFRSRPPSLFSFLPPWCCCKSSLLRYCDNFVENGDVSLVCTGVAFNL